MNQHRYPVTLTAEQRDQLTRVIRTGTSSSYQQVVARVLLKADHNRQDQVPTDGEIAQVLEISRRTIIRIKKRFVTEGLEAALWPGSRRTAALDLAPAGRPHGAVGACRSAQLRNRASGAQKNELKPWLKQSWCFPKATAEFVWRMEDVLDVYCRPYDPCRSLLCMDEMDKNLPIRGARPRPLGLG